MKRFEKFFIGCICLFLFIFLVGAVYNLTSQFPGGESSGLKTSSTVVLDSPGWLTGYQILTYNSSLVSVTIYDDKTAVTTGTVLSKGYCLQASYSDAVEFPVPIRASKGIYCVISGTGGNAVVHYRGNE